MPPPCFAEAVALPLCFVEDNALPRWSPSGRLSSAVLTLLTASHFHFWFTVVIVSHSGLTVLVASPSGTGMDVALSRVPS